MGGEARESLYLTRDGWWDPRELEPLTTTLPARSRSVLAAALAALLLGATLVSAHATEPASSPATPGPDMITTRLHPGWNSVG